PLDLDPGLGGTLAHIGLGLLGPGQFFRQKFKFHGGYSPSIRLVATKSSTSARLAQAIRCCLARRKNSCTSRSLVKPMPPSTCWPVRVAKRAASADRRKAWAARRRASVRPLSRAQAAFQAR